jgi:hypothetical protein
MRKFFIGLALLACVPANLAVAGIITFGGEITQSTGDGTGPAGLNPALNNVLDNDAYTVSLIFAGAIGGPGIFDLTGATMTFSDPAAGAAESSFDPISLTIIVNAGFDEFNLLGCLTTGSGCLVGNQLDATFEILASALNSPNVAATGLDEPHPLDLLEDDGSTDIHGSITAYSYTGPVNTVPEPRSMPWLSGALVALVATYGRRRRCCCSGPFGAVLPASPRRKP